MKINSGPHGGGRKSFMTWVGTLVLGTLVTFGSAHAAPPAAGTEIGNQALARYIDSGGTQQESKSNNALTVVQQVGGFTLVDSNTKSAAAGNTVYMPHTLTNTGNGSDKFKLSVAETLAGVPPFTKIAIYADANGTGLPSGSALCASDGATACTAGFDQIVAGNGGVFRFVVAYSVPPDATGSWTSKATVTATAGTPALYPSNNLTATNLDTVNLTTGAAFSVTKSLSLPGVKAPGGADWPKAITGGAPSAATCSTTWSAGLGSAAGCTYAVYTISFSNTGAAAGAFSVRDTLPDGMTYVTGSAVWSGKGGVALAEPTTTGDVIYSVDGKTLRATVANVAVSQQGTLSFVVLVNSTAKPDGSNTANVAMYGTGSCPAGPTVDTCTTTPTNKVPFTPSTVYGVVAASTAANPVKDASTPPAVSSDQNNLVIMPTVNPNGSVRFSNYIVNTGNGTDSFNIKTTNDTTNGYPAGTRFDLFKSDGLTPLLDTNNDGVPDTGPLEPGANVVVVVKAILPATVSVGAGPFNVLVTASSIASANLTLDSVWDQVTKVVQAAGVDLTNSAAGTGSGLVGNGDLGQGPSPNPTLTLGTTPGVAVAFPLFIKNNDTQDNSFTLNASGTNAFPGSLPASWTVSYYAAGTSCVPTPPATAMPAPVTLPLAVAAGAQLQVVACVTPGANAVTNVIQPIYFQAISTSNGSTGFPVSDILQDAVDVKPATFKKLLLTSSQTGQVSTPGSVVYLHTLSNVGTQTCGTGGFNVTVTMPPADVSAGWSYAVAYIDDSTGVTSPLGAGGTVPQLLSGKQWKLRLTVIAPAGVSDGHVNNATLTVTDKPAPGDDCGTVSNVDSTTAQTAKQLLVVKTQSADLACTGATAAFSTVTLTQKPGTCVIYQITATNNGATPLTNVSINDMVPAYTVWAPIQPPSQCVGSNTTGAISLGHVAGTTGVTCGTAATMGPGGTLTLTFGVQLSQ